MNNVVLLAGGSRTRMKSFIAKQHIIVKKHQIIEYMLRAFSESTEADGIFVVTNPNYYDQSLQLKFKYKK